MARESIPTITPFPSPPSFYRGPKEERREEIGRRSGIISLLSKWGQLQEADRSLVLSRHRVSFLDRSEGRHKGKKERKGGDASLERSRIHGCRHIACIRRIFSRYWDENIVNLAREGLERGGGLVAAFLHILEHSRPV